MEAYYNIHNLAGIRIKTKNPEIVNDCQHFLRTFKTEEKPNNIDIEITDFDEFSLPENSFNISGEFLGFKSGVCSKKDSYAVEINNDKMKIFLKDVSICINALIEYFLLKKGYTFIHGAGVSYKDKGILFPAPPNTGKTLLMSKLRQKDGIKFFGDDYIILGKNGRIYSYPMDFSIYNYHFEFFPELKGTTENKKIKKAFYERILVNIVKDLPIKNTLKHIARLIGYDFLYGGQFLKIPAQRLVAAEKMGTATELKFCVFLSGYNGKEFRIEKIELDRLATEALGILQTEWYKTLPVFHALSSVGALDFLEYLNNVKKTMVEGLNNLKLFRVLIPSNIKNKERLEKLEGFLNQEIFN